MKGTLLILSFFMLVSFTHLHPVKNSKTISITSKSELQINGTSNVKDFTCEYKIQNLNEPIQIHYEKTQDIVAFEDSILILENTGFDCGGRGINKDFHGLLQSHIYPKITLNLKEIKLSPYQHRMADALIDIEIAGVTRSYHMPTSYKHTQEWFISGKLKLNIKDFELEAPTKMLGLIVVSDEIEIDFNLVIEEH